VPLPERQRTVGLIRYVQIIYNGSIKANNFDKITNSAQKRVHAPVMRIEY
jgi:hypothetical protein